MSSAGQLLGQLVYQASPIVLTRGIATAMGGALPIVALTEGANFIAGALTGSNPVSLDTLFANFVALSGGTLAQNEVGMYPFANQAVAVNAIIAQPLSISLLMRVPATSRYGFASKLALMTALQKILNQHSLSGGTYSVITPAYIYTDCLLTNMSDAGEEQTQQQHSYRLDFIQPLVSLQAAQNAQNGLMQQLTAGSQLTGTPAWSGYSLTVGNPTSVLTTGLVPTSQ